MRDRLLTWAERSENVLVEALEKASPEVVEDALARAGDEARQHAQGVLAQRRGFAR